MWAFGLQLVLAVAVGSMTPAKNAMTAGLTVPVCVNGALAWVDPSGLPANEQERSQKALRDCTQCCPHWQAALVLPSAPGVLRRQGRAIERAVLPRQPVRTGCSTAPPPPARAPPASVT